VLDRVGALALGQVVTKGLAFAAFAWLARKLGAREYGAVEYALGIATFAALAIEFGLGAVGVRRLAQREHAVERIAATIAAAQSCIALVVAPAMVLFALLFADDAHAVTLTGLAALSVLILPWRQEWLFQARGSVGPLVANQILRAGVFAIGVVALVGGSDDVDRVGTMEIASVAAATIYLAARQTRSIAPIRARFALPEILDLAREAAPIGAAAIVWALIQYAPLMMVANMAGMVDTAYFGAAHRLGVSLVTFSWIYHFNFYPAIAQRLADREAVAALTRASFRLAAWGGIGIAMALTLAAEPLLTLLYGERFTASVPPFSVLVWTFPVTLLSGHARWILVAGRRARDMLVAQLAGGLVALAGGPLLVGRYGIVGAAATMVVACIVIWAVAQAFVTVRVRAAPLAPCLRPGVLAAAIIALVHAFDASPWVGCAIGVVAYTALAPLVDRALAADYARVRQARSPVSVAPNTGDAR
jgi:O-antigen/teichoic acid export membrane protein